MKRLHIRPTHALTDWQLGALILNFWQRYASRATAAAEAYIASQGHTGGLVATLCFPICKITFQVTIKNFMQLAQAAKLEPFFLCRAPWRAILLLESSRLQLWPEG